MKGMTRITGAVKLGCWVTNALLLVFFAEPAVFGNDLQNVDFSLRFPAAISSFASYGDVAGVGGAQAAGEWSSSTNPASAAWPHPDIKFKDGVSPQYAFICFDEGTELNAFTEAVTIDAGNWGVFVPAAALVVSNHGLDHKGFGFEFDADYFQLQWGKAIAKNWAIGANFNVTVSDTKSDLAQAPVAHAQSQSYNIRLGLENKALPRLRVGAVVDYAFAPTRTDVQVFNPLTFAFEKVRLKDTTQQGLFRTGIAWEYAKGSTFFLDYQGGFFSNRTGTLWVHRFPIGIEQMLIKNALYIRVGTKIDTRGNVAFTTGLGIYPNERFSIDVAYQRDVFTEIRQEFGGSQGLVVSLGLAF